MLHIKGIHLHVLKSKMFCQVACSQATDIEMDRTEHNKLQNADLIHQFRSVCLRSSTARYTYSRICLSALNERFL
jgi:hypothetical protein